jgi:hypothetical protein
MVLAYADDLKLCMRVSSTDDCRLFQQDLDHQHGWCREKKYDLNAGKCRFVSFSRGSKPVMFQYFIGDSYLEHDDLINDLGLVVDNRSIKHGVSIVRMVDSSRGSFGKNKSRILHVYVETCLSVS